MCNGILAAAALERTGSTRAWSQMVLGSKETKSWNRNWEKRSRDRCNFCYGKYIVVGCDFFKKVSSDELSSCVIQWSEGRRSFFTVNKYITVFATMALSLWFRVIPQECKCSIGLQLVTAVVVLFPWNHLVAVQSYSWFKIMQTGAMFGPHRLQSTFLETNLKHCTIYCMCYYIPYLKSRTALKRNNIHFREDTAIGSYLWHFSYISTSSQLFLFGPELKWLFLS